MIPISTQGMQRLKEIPGFMWDDELEWIAKTAATVKSWTEVGVYCGKSAFTAGMALPPGGLLQLVDIDFRSRFYPHLEWFLRKRPDVAITLCSATSVEAAKILPKTERVFIDDYHAYPDVLASIKAWQNRCQIIYGHDYCKLYDGVTKAVDQLYPEVKNPVRSIWSSS